MDILGPFDVLKRPLTLGLAKAGSADKSGPLIWWKLDEAQGVTAMNAAGSACAGTIRGDPHWTPAGGVQAGALEFDGKNNRVEAAVSSGLDFQNGLTLAAWFKVRKFEDSGETLLAKGEAWRLQRKGKKGNIEFLMKGPLTPKRGVTPGKPVNLSTKEAVDDGLWHHAAVTYDGSRAVLYLDGAEEAATAATGSISPNNIPVTLGDNHVLRGRCFNGWIDDTRIYGRGLSAEEVKALAVRNKGLAKD